MALSHGPSIVTQGLVLALDAADRNSYPGSGTTWTDLSGNGNNFTLYNSSYYSYNSNDGGFIDFNRTMPPAPETGGYAEHAGSGALAVSNYLYNNHTTEIWANIDDLDRTLYNITESQSALLVYQGYHSMFRYNTSSLVYGIWNGTSGEQFAPSIVFGQDIYEGQWFQAVAVRNGNNLSSYFNGILKGTNIISTPNGVGNVTNNIKIGMANPSNQNYSWHADTKVSSVRMYNKALTASEIQQNFNALRGRFGI